MRTLAQRAPVPVTVDVDEPVGRLPGHVETAAYFVVAESLANIAKYAEASEAWVTVGRENGSAHIEIRDDGRGGARPDRGTGLRGLADRVGALDGEVTIESARAAERESSPRSHARRDRRRHGARPRRAGTPAAGQGFDVCGRAHDGAELVAMWRKSPPDAVVTDIRMPPTHTDEGLVAAAEIRARFPETSVLVLSQYVEIGYALRLIEGQEGHCGYLLKDRVTNASEIVDALNRVTAGEMVVDAELVTALLARPRSRDPLDELSEHEREVLALMAEGLTDRGIAERLWLSTATVETHVRHILQKLSLSPSASSNRRVQAVLTYLRA